MGVDFINGQEKKKIKNAMTYLLSKMILAKIKTSDHTKCQRVNPQNLSHIAAGKANWKNHFGKQFFIPFKCHVFPFSSTK